MRYHQNTFKTTLSRANYFWAVLKTRLLRKNNPVICCLVVNNRCNLNCKYCFGDYPNKRVPDYTTEELKKLIDDLYRLGTRYLNIHGGETLLRKDVGEIVDYIKNKGMYCCLITNGILLPQRIDEIRNVDNITISLDGRRENNDKNRGPGSFDKALEAIKLVIKEKIPLRVSATLTRHTMNDIGYLGALGKEMGFTVLFSLLFKSFPEATDWEMSDKEIRTAMDKIIEYKKQGLPIFTSFRAAECARDWPFNHNKYHYLKKKDSAKLPKDFKAIKCYFGKIKFAIEGDGFVYPCFVQGDSSHFKALNWREVGLEKAIRHVQETNDCIACPTLAQNDHNLLLGLDLRQIAEIIFCQFRESLRRR